MERAQSCTLWKLCVEDSGRHAIAIGQRARTILQSRDPKSDPDPSYHCARPLSLTVLRNDGPIRVGAPMVDVPDANRAVGRAPLSTICEQIPEADGFLFHSRFTGGVSVAVLGRAIGGPAISQVMSPVEIAGFPEAPKARDIVPAEPPG